MAKLYDYWRSSASYRVRIALGLAELDYDTEVVNLLEGQHLKDSHLARNPQGLVPALDIDGYTMTQSLAIIQYLDETLKLGLLPNLPIERAQVRALSYAIAMEIHPVCNLHVVDYAVSESGGQIDKEQWMQHFIDKGLRAYEAMIGDGTYSYGDTVTLADICLVPQLYNADRWGVDLTDMPKIRRARAALEAIPAFANAHPDKCNR
ncbi:maleylacetoacetate isomerase [Cognatishimia maritima]|uniref:Maleylacetoacetate isomerase n=1 Tax=Cognatishimia maritima TaxID=870908 RepID=A0A1M5VX75_9RHOB|nr:maleylacetoacetate isomerase [Cognatishimia maritima]SHH79892.1 maleylacetoacetate isomerase [Cognatishimia maritima]